MPDPVTATIAGGATLIGGAVSSSAQKDAASSAANAQEAAAMMSVAEQRRQFDIMQSILQPYTDAGEIGLSSQMDLLGLSGEEAQQAAISNIQNSPLFQSQIQAGEEAMLQQASATGGLRGGNTQAALAQYRPAMLSQEINNQYAKLGGLTQLGQASAAGVGSAALNLGTNIGAAYSNIGAAQAGQALAVGQANAQIGNSISQLGGLYLGSKLF